MIKIKLLGISATPINNGNCDNLVQYALGAAKELGDVETKFINTADKEIMVCRHCQWCIENRSPCKFKDDVHEILDSIEECDGFIVGSPAWLNTLSPFLINIFSRARYQVFFTNKFRNRVAGLLTLGFFGIGMEHALDTMHNILGGMYILTVGVAWAIGSSKAYGQRPEYLERGVLDDKWGLIRTKAVAHRVVEVSRMIKYAREAGIILPAELQRTPVGGKVTEPDEKVFVDGVWREKQK